MLRNALLTFTLLALVAPAVQAQNIDNEIELSRAVIQAERKALVEAVVRPTAQQDEEFWTVYWNYRGQLGSLGDRTVALIREYADSYGSLTDEQAQRLLKESVDIDVRESKIKKSFLKKFNKVLTPIQVARLYQVENKLDAVIKFELAAEIPLAE
ncbi:MAG: hypothetical protein GY906_12605 [bacterium]|nr:hypothetical protein [bacterium]